MAIRERMSGNEAVAHAIKQINPDVMAAFPITPSTEIPQMVSTFIANGDIDTEFIPVESEHSSMSATMGACAAGARAITATSSCGLAYMWEVLYVAASDRLPIVMAVVNRALTGPININCDHSDSMGARDAGWIQIYAENNQEAYDNYIQAFRIAEHPDVKLPFMACQDGFITSHAVENISLIETEKVKEFVGSYEPENFLLNADMPMAVGPYANSPFYMETKMNQRIFGKPGFDIFTNYANFDWSNFVFNLVFCATTATIVSGAMAERTKFLSYCVYSAVISAVIYPIEAHWTWGGGWLSKMGFHDFAGSNCIHMVGGICALIGAAILGPRIGKFKKQKDGSIKVGAFPGHNLALGALGVFILWLGWYGFNGAAATSVPQLGAIFTTTTIAPSVATVVCMIFTWIRYGKPDVSMCLNASLAGLVAITAPCDVADATGAIVIGAVSGVLVVFGVWLLDNKLRVDDPVGAVAVHMMNGIWGTIAVGLFATDSTPTYSLADANGDKLLGLFYGGGFKLLGIQLTGMLATAAWTAVTITITFLLIKKIFGLRVSAEEEITGLDATEHGLETAYAGFMTYGDHISSDGTTTVSTPAIPENAVPEDEAVPVQVMSGGTGVASDVKLTKISIICKQNKFEDLKNALNDAGVTGITVTQVLGCGAQKGQTKYYRGVKMDMT